MSASTKNDILKNAMLQALEKCLGIVSDAAKMVDIDRTTHYRWMSTDKDYKAKVEDLSNVALDFVESKLFEKISGVKVKTGTDKEGQPIIYDQPPSDTAIIFYLKTKGKARGYAQDEDSSSEQKVTVEIAYVKQNNTADNTWAAPRPGVCKAKRQTLQCGKQWPPLG